MSTSGLRLSEDVKPLSDFRANISTILKQIKDTKRPILITQSGKAAVVVMDVKEYEKLVN